MILGYFAASGPGRFAIVKGKILIPKMIIVSCRIKRGWLSARQSSVEQQDNDPKHCSRSKSTVEWLEKENLQFAMVLSELRT